MSRLRCVSNSAKIQLIFITWLVLYLFIIYTTVILHGNEDTIHKMTTQQKLYQPLDLQGRAMQHTTEKHISLSLPKFNRRRQTTDILGQTGHKNSARMSLAIKIKDTTPPTLSNPLGRDEHLMFLLHEKSSQKLTKKEMLDYFRRELISETRFSRIMDLRRDRNSLSTLFPSSLDDNNDRITDQLRVRLRVSRKKLIFLTNGDVVNSRKKFLEDKCNVKQCIFTSNQKDLTKADAILDQSRYSSFKLKLGQLHIVYQLESAMTVPRLDYSNVPVNWTATYRRDSVLSAPYGRFTPYVNVTELPSTPKRNFATGKKKLVAWFVSNCNARNGRSKYVKQLAKFIQVDIFGPCGKLRCFKYNSQCFRILKKEYKFYLAFENSNCKDYVTEKLFLNALENDVIPIVMGAHRNEVKRIAPPNSYIHVDDFESPQQLAEYLKFLEKNDEAYNQYFLWKDTGRFINTKFMCRLCTMVHLAPHFPMWYTDVNTWWAKDMCRERQVHHWTGSKEAKPDTSTVKYGL